MSHQTAQAHHAADDQKYYTPQTLAQLWVCSKDVVYDLLRSGKLRGFRLGRDWRISDAARLQYEKLAEPPRKVRVPAGTGMRVV